AGSEKFIAVTRTYVHNWRRFGSGGGAPGLPIRGLGEKAYPVGERWKACIRHTRRGLRVGAPERVVRGTRSVSRVLSRTVIPLRPVSPPACSGLPGSARGSVL